MLTAIKRALGFTPAKRKAAPRAARAAVGHMLARYDAAQTSSENRRHWAMSDGLSAAAANSPEVRRIIRNRARYEVANNPVLSGIVKTWVNDVIGTGPRLQVRLPMARQLAQFIEAEFAAWMRETRLLSKLITCRRARAIDGEAFAVTFANDALASPVKLDIRPLECDRIANPAASIADPSNVDGIIIDANGTPTTYQVLRSHPGNLIRGGLWEFDAVSAREMLHWVQIDRPEQVRGVCEFTASLPLGAQLRRYSTATLGAAELVALLSVIFETDGQGEDPIPPFDELQLERMGITGVPPGSNPRQIEPNQPISSYAEFTNAQIGQMGRPLCMTYAIAAGDYSKSSYASSRMEDRNYGEAVLIDRAAIEEPQLDRLFAMWLAEARTIVGYLPPEIEDVRSVPITWHWKSRPHVDPQKTNNAIDTALKNGTKSLAEAAAESGADWYDRALQIAVERRTLATVGMVHPVDLPPMQTAQAQAEAAQDGNEPDTEQEFGDAETD